MHNKEFLAEVFSRLQQFTGEISDRNDDIEDRDAYIYDDLLERSIDIPIGHDFTPVNWLKRTVEIHKTMFMGRPFQLISTYDVKDVSNQSEEDRKRLEIENKKEKDFAEQRRNVWDAIIRDNGGHALFVDGAESASAIGTWIVKSYYDKDKQKQVLSPVEAVENCYVLWDKDDFRQFSLMGYLYQVNKDVAVRDYGLDPEQVSTAPAGNLLYIEGEDGGQTPKSDTVTIAEFTGQVEGWKPEGKSLVRGKTAPFNALFVGTELVRLIADEKDIPKYYIFPNKKARRRPWGLSDITDAAININATYIETLSDWRTVAMKINFPKFKGFNFAPGETMPKMNNRKIEMLPLSEGQDVVPLQTGDSNGVDFGRQLDELKEQFVRETGISRVLFDDPSITLNSNQALLTSMKPTSDIAENKKQLWGPILAQMFTDALHMVAAHNPKFKELADGNWNAKVQWPSVMQKEDPVFQQMLLNRWNSGTMSLQTYLEMQGETKEEIDRMRDEFYDPITAAAIGHQMGGLAQYVLGLPNSQQEFSGPQATQANNTPGTQPVSQPGSGATAVSPQGAINQVTQQQGQ